VPSPQLPGDYKCRDFNEHVAQAVRGMDTLVIAARWRRWLSLPEAELDLRATLAVVAPGVHRILIVAPTPELPDTPFRCIRARDPDACAISRVEFDTQAGPTRKRLAAIAADIPNVEVIDPAEFLCTASQCPATKNGVGLYVDAIHPTHTAAIAFALRYLGH